ncbi:MAG: hypothetical protein COZ51_02450 [Candidatus Aquicultor secundus]|nr:MAG: hypothetical protein COZ51_02450 [Candidatus Aquicultor secundus]
MKKKSYKTLLAAAETITQDELRYASELSTFVALDGTLMATMTSIEFNYPHLGDPKSGNWGIPEGVEEHFMDSIFTLAKALRSSMHAYYAAIQENCNNPGKEEEISF